MTNTPWGPAQTAKQIAPGINAYTTAGHGGFHLNLTRRLEMPARFQAFKPFAEPGWYEEDCDCAIVVLAFPQYFSAEDRDNALLSVAGNTRYYGDILTPDQKAQGLVLVANLRAGRP